MHVSTVKNYLADALRLLALPHSNELRIQKSSEEGLMSEMSTN